MAVRMRERTRNGTHCAAIRCSIFLCVLLAYISHHRLFGRTNVQATEAPHAYTSGRIPFVLTEALAHMVCYTETHTIWMFIEINEFAGH